MFNLSQVLQECETIQHVVKAIFESDEPARLAAEYALDAAQHSLEREILTVADTSEVEGHLSYVQEQGAVFCYADALDEAKRIIG